MAKLKPCPFCGCTFPKMVQDGICDFYLYVFCPICNSRTSYGRDEEEAAKEWNRRVNDG